MNNKALIEVDFTEPKPTSFWDKFKKGIIGGNIENKLFKKFSIKVNRTTEKAQNLFMYASSFLDSSEFNTIQDIDITIKPKVLTDGASIPMALVVIIFLSLSIFTLWFLIPAFITVAYFNGNKIFGKAGLFHDAMFQQGGVYINKCWVVLSFWEANEFFYYLSIYYGKSKVIAGVATFLLFFSYPVWIKCRRL